MADAHTRDGNPRAGAAPFRTWRSIMPGMRVASWNVNSLPARLPRVLEWIGTQAPDILLLQETKCTDEAFPAAAFAELGYSSAHHGEGRWNGVAIISRGPLEAVAKGLGLPSPGGLAGCAGWRRYANCSWPASGVCS